MDDCPMETNKESSLKMCKKLLLGGTDMSLSFLENPPIPGRELPIVDASCIRENSGN